MKLRLHVQTPPGQGEGTEKKLRTFLLAWQRPQETGYKDDGFYWELDCDYKAYVRLTKRVYLFQQLAGGVIGNKVFRGAATRLGATPSQFHEVEDMLFNGTKITIVKNATAQEMEDGTTTYWEKFKQGFKRRE